MVLLITCKIRRLKDDWICLAERLPSANSNIALAA